MSAVGPSGFPEWCLSALLIFCGWIVSLSFRLVVRFCVWVSDGLSIIIVATVVSFPSRMFSRRIVFWWVLVLLTVSVVIVVVIFLSVLIVV